MSNFYISHVVSAVVFSKWTVWLEITLYRSSVLKSVLWLCKHSLLCDCQTNCCNLHIAFLKDKKMMKEDWVNDNKCWKKLGLMVQNDIKRLHYWQEMIKENCIIDRTWRKKEDYISNRNQWKKIALLTGWPCWQHEFQLFRALIK